MKITKWKESKFGKMNFESVCRTYSSNKSLSLEPPFVRACYISDGKNRFAVRWNKYEVGANFSGNGVEADYFVLNGKCEITFDDEIVRLRKDEYFKFSKGKYNFKVIGNGPFEYIAVYKLPEDYNFSIE